jgi:hypothetical protein
MADGRGRLRAMILRLVRWTLLLGLVMVLTACKGKTTCKDWAAGYGERSTVTWSNCSDGSKREIECKLFGPGKYDCKCIKDGVVGKPFDHTTSVLGDKEKSTRIANEACGWDLST